jgi:hypothetical protein
LWQKNVKVYFDAIRKVLSEELQKTEVMVEDQKAAFRDVISLLSDVTNASKIDDAFVE